VAGSLEPLPATIRGHQQYRIGAGDLLEIEVFQVPELTSQERVNVKGIATLPLIGRVRLGGLSTAEAEREIAARLEKEFLQDPQVNVHIKEYASQRVTVAGAVKKPGVYPVKGSLTLMQAIALAQGMTPLAAGDKVLVFRVDSAGTPQTYAVDLDKIQRGQDADPTILANDRIVVPESGSMALIKGVTDTLRGFVGGVYVGQ